MTLPMPRLEMRWRKPNQRELKNGTLGPPDWVCDYALILPLREFDIRRKRKRDFISLKLGGTTCRTSAPTMEHAPYRDGVHAFWDSEALGGLPIFVVGSDGIARPHHRSAE